MPKLLLSDVDGTLIHRQKEGDAIALDLAWLERANYVSTRVVEQLRDLRKRGFPVVLISSRRGTTFVPVRQKLAHYAAISEDGCVICNAAGQIDSGWLDHVTAELGAVVAASRVVGGAIGEVRRAILASPAVLRRDVVLDDDGFVVSFKLTLSAEELRLAERNIQSYVSELAGGLPTTLRATLNTQDRSVLVIPTRAGKRNAAEYLMRSLGVTWADVWAAGNDMNDLDMLSVVGKPMTLSGAHPEIIKLVNDRGGFCAPETRHAGTAQILNAVVAHATPRPDAPSVRGLPATN